MKSPGLTGYAQVNGRNAISWEEKFNMMCVCGSYNIFRDWKILLQTLFKVITREGINSETAATMEDFLGSDRKGRGNYLRKN